ncbi:EamA family transporter [Bacillus pseudomycoides]|uniref:EamA family transporter n=1 Tax=Bacillus pseudomycoides TaxID=64104 RepID=A0AA91ZTV1_9BACI|nr:MULTISPECIES: DMT family transporter [Bacillus]PED82722.1 EamA family transporter [Bacillus pseudomycoides]PEU21084.1 EamA family transporter [Bacillus sp. AFS014408]PFW65091.1 EamA family transporter [Bacillus sp. AFS075034]
MKITKSMANILLLLIAVFWGSAVVATKIALDANASPGFINFFRGSLFAVLILMFFYKKIFKMTFKDFKIGLIAGLLNFGGFITQTIGIQYTTPSNNAFIAATYVVIVPFMAWAIYQKKPQVKIFVSIFFCLVGMTILTGILNETLTINIGDVYSFICAVFYAGSIVYLSYGVRATDVSIVAFMLAVVQTIGGLFFFFFVETGQLTDINWSVAIVPLLYMGIICSFVSQTVQVLAQKHTSATSAGLIMMLEGVFGSIFSVAFGFEIFTVKLVVGGMLIMLSIILMEVDYKQILLKNKERLREP